MDVRVLGPIEVYVDGADVTPTSPNQRTVLAVLCAHPDQHVRMDTLVDAVWDCDPPATAERTLRSYVSRLRAVIGPGIVAGGGGFCLRTKDIKLDSIEFERRVRAAQLLEARAAADTLRAAIGLWHGSAFGECAELGAVCAEARGLEQLKMVARQELADALLRGADYVAATAQAEALLVETPLDERVWEILIRAQTGAGRTADALHHYRRAHEELAAVGLEPSERLRLAERDAFDAPASVPATPSCPPVGADLLEPTPRQCPMHWSRHSDWPATVARRTSCCGERD
ncbi:MAG: AfsR/SARP family transcriptional regulator [Mycobacterium sp.]